MARRVQLLYFSGCPHIVEARTALREALGDSATFAEVDTTSADCPPELRAWGSPTILVDGRDVGGASRGDGAACRVYVDAGVRNGAPSPDMIRRAVGML